MKPQIFGLNVLIYMVVILQVTHSQNQKQDARCTVKVICEKNEDGDTQFEICMSGRLSFQIKDVLYEVFSNYTGMDYKFNGDKYFREDVLPEICKREYSASKAFDAFDEEIESFIDKIDFAQEFLYRDFEDCMELAVKKCAEKEINKCMEEEEKKFKEGFAKQNSGSK